MPSNKIVLDTNCLLVSISKYGEAYPVWRGFLDGCYTLCVSAEILEEYEEIIGSMATSEIARNVVDAILKRKTLLTLLLMAATGAWGAEVQLQSNNVPTGYKLDGSDQISAYTFSSDLCKDDY